MHDHQRVRRSAGRRAQAQAPRSAVSRRLRVALIRCYPRDWRMRYEHEIADLLAREPASPRLVLDLLRGAFDAHLHPQQPGPASARLRRAIGLVLLAACLLIGGYVTRHPATAGVPGTTLRSPQAAATATPVEHGYGQRGSRPE